MADADPTLSHMFQTHRQGLAGAVRSVLGGSADVTEVLQDAFLKCWRDWQRGTRPDDPVAWIFVVVWNVAVDARRRRQRQPIHETLDEDQTVTPNTLPSPSHALEQREDCGKAQHLARSEHAQDSAGCRANVPAAAKEVPAATHDPVPSRP
ncbi:MAG TPA: sigma-70 family RNA polymerase sigma factor, partial [Planctomycetota bacterium]|nr:sigma-70 family RNA polymerase sigma factor [Planctomycetota bacterium]